MTTIIKDKIIRADLSLWDGRDKTTSRKDSTGGTIVGLKIGVTVDVLQIYGGGISYTKSTIQKAADAIGALSVALIFNPGTWTIDENLTLASNFACIVPNGCYFNVASGITLTFNGPVYHEKIWTSGNGTIVESGTRSIGGKLDLTATVLQGGTPLIFEGATDDGYETSLILTNPTADRTIIIPDKNLDLGTIPTLNVANTFTGPITMSGASVIEANASIAAHATTMNPWGLGNYVTLTGAAVSFTDFADAPQAGAEVELYCNTTHTFIDNANLEVDGDANFVAETGDRVLVRAKSTTVFTIHPRKKTGRAIYGGKLIQRVEATPYTTYASITTPYIPDDDTIPQNTEGVQILTVPITPTNANNRLVIRCASGHIGGDPTILVLGSMVLFQDSTAGALAGVQEYFAATTRKTLSLVYEMAAGTIVATTFKIHIGTTTGTIYINGVSAGRVFGGISAVRLSVEEIAV